MVHIPSSRPVLSFNLGEGEVWTIVLSRLICPGGEAELKLLGFPSPNDLGRLIPLCLSFLVNIANVSVIARSASNVQKRYTSGGIAHHRIPHVRPFSHDHSLQVAAK